MDGRTEGGRGNIERERKDRCTKGGIEERETGEKEQKERR